MALAGGRHWACPLSGGTGAPLGCRRGRLGPLGRCGFRAAGERFGGHGRGGLGKSGGPAKFVGVAGAIKVQRRRLFFPRVHRCHRPGWAGSRGAQTRTTGGVGIGRGELLSKVRGEGCGRQQLRPGVVWCVWPVHGVGGVPGGSRGRLLPSSPSHWVCGVGPARGTAKPIGVSRVFKACVVRVWRSPFSLCHRSLFFPHFLSPFPSHTVHMTFTNISSTRYPARVQVRLFRVQHSSSFLPSAGHSCFWLFLFFFFFFLVRLFKRASLYTAFVPLEPAVCERVFDFEGLAEVAACSSWPCKHYRLVWFPLPY